MIYYQDLLFFHIFVIIIVMGVLKFITENYIPEIFNRERQKLGTDNTEANNNYSFFITLTETHSSMNLLMIAFLLLFEILYLENYITILDIQADIFQASITLISIVIGFSALILGNRVGKNTKGWKKQTYQLRGLMGITLLFVVIAIVAFIAQLLQPIILQQGLPTINQIVTDFFSSYNIRMRVIAAFANEFVIFSVPAALFYLFSLSRDLIERYEKEGEESNKVY